jgi:hypothetical protein
MRHGQLPRLMLLLVTVNEALDRSNWRIVL